MVSIDFKCAICEASFRHGVLDKHGKCPSCAKEFPEAKTRLEAMAMNKPEIHLNPELNEDRVRQIVKEELDRILVTDPKGPKETK